MTWTELSQEFKKVADRLMETDSTTTFLPDFHGAPSKEMERWADEWVANCFQDKGLPIPTPEHRYVLAPRFVYAWREISLFLEVFGEKQLGNPESAWKEFLIENYYQKYRAQWIAGEERAKRQERSPGNRLPLDHN
jgi:hypothetical protein